MMVYSNAGKGMMRKKIAIIILNYNGSLDTIECLQSLKTANKNFEYNILILDNGSKQSEKDKLSEWIACNTDYSQCTLSQFLDNECYEDCYIDSEVNFGFAKGNNIVIEKIKHDYQYILLLNNDTVVEKDFFDIMIEFLDNKPEIKFASCRINNYYEKNKLWNCGGVLNLWGNRRYYSEKELNKFESTVPTTFITGCALFISTSLIVNEPCFTEKFFFGEEDYEFCMRMKKRSVKSACINKTLVYHKVSASSNKTSTTVGKMAVHFSNRAVDMQSFYPKIVWIIWRKVMLALLYVKSARWGFEKKSRVNLINTVKYYSTQNVISCEDTFKMMKIK